ncbi:TIGR00341 family protein [Haloarculaceae archaeon H-GB2-1]|nr:TIGR00341 family protein [Haloarculaceae archaeon H-GB1-1]MEA5406920.1 TIGR00341 family protein [Haloarculaceae archaeon H-GB2-1]
MRLVQITIPTGKREAVLKALDSEGVDYVISDETSGKEYTGIAYIPLPTNAVEPILEQLREAGLDGEAYTVVLDAKTVVSRDFEKLEERYETDDDVDDERIAREELATKADEMAPSLPNYAAMTLISALIATAGLLLDSPAVVVGSMVIAPLVGPSMTAAVGTVLDDREMFLRGMKLQMVGLLLAVGGAAVFGWAAKTLHLIPPFTDVTSIPEIRERLSPDFLSLMVALGAGAAGVISLSSGVSTALVGVMIAVALVPPAATVGIGIAWGLPAIVVAAGVLALVNWLSINVAALAVLWKQGYRPRQWFRTDDAREATAKRIGVFLAAIAVLSVFMGGITYDSYQGATVQHQIQEETLEVLEAEQDATLIDIEIERSEEFLLQKPKSVIVTVGVPAGKPVDGLAERIDERIESATGVTVETQVRYVITETA